MKELGRNQEQRRKVLTALGMGAVAAPFLGLSACGGGESEPATPSSTVDSMAEKASSAMEGAEKRVDETMDKAESAMQDSMDDAADAMEDAESAVQESMDDAAAAAEEAAGKAEVIARDAATGAQVDENSPQAAGLGYRHDATTVDGAVQTRFAAGQQCANCVLFQGGGAEWGGCPLFAGQLVKSTGWCSAYSAAG